jgi:hypothetical protein
MTASCPHPARRHPPPLQFGYLSSSTHRSAHGQKDTPPSIVVADWPSIRQPDLVDVAGVRVDLTAVRQARKVVLVEGSSDQAALEVLAQRRGLALGPGALCIVAMGGATSIGHFVRLLGPDGLNIPLGGLCDAGEEDYVRAALRQGGLSPGASRAQLETSGFYVCTADLEDELIRAVGTATVQQIIAASGEQRPFRTFQRQPAHRQERVDQQLHRFMGTHSGRKSQYARLLAEAVAPASIPRPLDLVLTGR